MSTAFYESITECLYVNKANSGNLANSLPTLFSAETDNLAFQGLQSQIHFITQKYDSLLSDYYTQSFAQIQHTITQCNFNPGQLATLVVMKGVNLPDHTHFFSLLFTFLRQHVSKYVVELDHSNSSTIKATVKTFFRQLSGSASNTFVSLQKLTHLIDQEQGPLLIVIKNMEEFNTEVLVQLLRSLFVLSSEIPIVLFLGISTTTDNVFQSMPVQVVSKLNINKVHLLPSQKQLSLIFNDIVLADEFAVKFSPKVSSFMSEKFFFDDFSPSNYLKRVKYCLIHHYMQEEHPTFLCAPFENIQDHLKTVKPKTLEPFVTKKTTNKPNIIRKQFEQDSSELITYFNKIKQLVKVISAVHTNVVSCPLGKNSFSCYAEILDPDFCNSDDFTGFTLWLRTLDHEKLSSVCETFRETFTQEDRMAELLTELSNCELRQESSSIVKFDKGLKLGDLKEHLKTQLEERMSPFERTRVKITSFMEKFIRDIISVDVLALPNANIWVYDNYKELNTRFASCNRTAVAKALTTPGVYLKCDCCADTNYPAKPLPVLSNVYMLHREQRGTVVNVFDWLQSFLLVVDDAMSSNRKREKLKVNEKLYVMFIQALSDLQFMGYIKSSKRKSDHVTKLTWNGI